MTSTIQIGRRLIPIEHIALVEPFDPAAQSRMLTERPFQARVVLLDRDSVLTEEAPAAFAEAHGFRVLGDDNVGTNPAVRFSVETFEKTEGFQPSKPYRSRLLWRDLEGNTQSKLLLSEPAAALAIAVKGVTPTASAPESGEGPGEPPSARAAKRRKARRKAPEPVPF